MLNALPKHLKSIKYVVLPTVGVVSFTPLCILSCTLHYRMHTLVYSALSHPYSRVLCIIAYIRSCTLNYRIHTLVYSALSHAHLSCTLHYRMHTSRVLCISACIPLVHSALSHPCLSCTLHSRMIPHSSVYSILSGLLWYSYVHRVISCCWIVTYIV